VGTYGDGFIPMMVLWRWGATTRSSRQSLYGECLAWLSSPPLLWLCFSFLPILTWDEWCWASLLR